VGGSERANSVHCHQQVSVYLKNFSVIYLPVVATGWKRAPLQPVAVTGEKRPKNPSLMAGAGDWPPHQHVWGAYELQRFLLMHDEEHSLSLLASTMAAMATSL